MPPTSNDLLLIGRFTRPHGVRGQIVLEVSTRFAPRLDEVDYVYVGEQREQRAVLDAHWHRGVWLVQLDRCPNREAAEHLRGQRVSVERTAHPLPPGEYYPEEVLGLIVITDAGEELGKLTDVLETGANDVYVVNGAQGEILLPVIPSVILNVDLPNQRLTVHLLEGLR